jgi:hypothetical protein
MKKDVGALEERLLVCHLPSEIFDPVRDGRLARSRRANQTNGKAVKLGNRWRDSSFATGFIPTQTRKPEPINRNQISNRP